MQNNQRPFSLSTFRTITLLLHYFIGYAFIYRILASQITLYLQPASTYILPSIQWTMYGLVTVITVLLAWPSIKHSYQRFRDNISRNLAYIAILCVVGIVLNIALSMLISTLTNTTGSNNQQSIQEASNVIPLMTIVSSCIVAPIVEECVFRSGLFTFLRRKLNFVFAAIISSAFFASIHFVDALFTGNFNDLSYLIVYTGIGIVLAYAYEKSDSIMVSGSVHFLNNALSMITMFLG